MISYEKKSILARMIYEVHKIYKVDTPAGVLFTAAERSLEMRFGIILRRIRSTL
jgi:hypothetical protein